MDLIDIIKLAIRRWYVTLPLVIVTGLSAVLVQEAAPREFEAEGTVLLATPELDPSTSPQAIVDLSQAVFDLRSVDARDRISAEGGTGDYEITRIDNTQLEITAPGVSAQAQTTVGLILDELSNLIRDRQEEAGLPDDERLVPRTSVQFRETDGTVLTEPPDPQASETTAAQVAIETVGLLSVEDPTAGRGNPFGADDSTARILEEAIESQVGRVQLHERLGTDVLQDYNVDPRGGPGIVRLVVITSERDAALDAFDALRDALGEELELRQARADVPTIQRLTVEELAAPIDAEDITGPIGRATAVVVALGGLMTVALLLTIEAVVSRHRQSHRPSGGEGFPQATLLDAETDASTVDGTEQVRAGDDQPDPLPR